MLIYFALLLAPVLAETVSLGPEDDVQAALDAAAPGDIIELAAGTYVGRLETAVGGTADAPITLRSARDADGEPELVWLQDSGEVLQIDHPWFVIDGLRLDGLYGSRAVLDVNDGAQALSIVGVEVAYGGRSCVDIAGPADVVIADLRVHHCLWWDAVDGRMEAHGVAVGPVQGLTISGLDVSDFSGDGVLIGPSRLSPGWRDVSIDDARITLSALSEDANGFSAGTVPGGDGLETRTWAESERATLRLSDVHVQGVGGALVSAPFALRLQERVDVTLDGVEISDGAGGVGVWGPSDAHPGGVRLVAYDVLLHSLDVGIAGADGPESMVASHVTVGLDVGRALELDASSADAFALSNAVFLDDALPDGVSEEFNAAVTEAEFVDAAGGDYRLADDAAAIDAGVLVVDAGDDLAGAPRPSGAAPDLGAYEWQEAGGDDTGEPSDGGSGDGGSLDTGVVTVDGGATDGGASVDTGPPDLSAGDLAGEAGGWGCTTSRAAPAGLAILLWLAVVLGARRED